MSIGGLGGVSKHGTLIPEHKHGSITGYTHYGCRCDLCKAEARRFNHDQHMKRRKGRPRWSW